MSQDESKAASLPGRPHLPSAGPLPPPCDGAWGNVSLPGRWSGGAVWVVIGSTWNVWIMCLDPLDWSSHRWECLLLPSLGCTYSGLLVTWSDHGGFSLQLLLLLPGSRAWSSLDSLWPPGPGGSWVSSHPSLHLLKHGLTLATLTRTFGHTWGHACESARTQHKHKTPWCWLLLFCCMW